MSIVGLLVWWIVGFAFSLLAWFFLEDGGTRKLRRESPELGPWETPPLTWGACLACAAFGFLMPFAVAVAWVWGVMWALSFRNPNGKSFLSRPVFGKRD